MHHYIEREQQPRYTSLSQATIIYGNFNIPNLEEELDYDGSPNAMSHLQG